MMKNTLIEKYLKAKSESAFREIVEEFTPLIYSACYRRMLDSDVSKDITQQVFMDFIKKAKTLVEHPNVSGWFYKVTMYRITNYLSKKSKENSRMRKFEQLTEVRELSKENKKLWLDRVLPDLDEAVLSLPEKLQQAIVEHYMSGKSISEASQILEVNEVTLRKRLSRAVKFLRDYFNARGTAVSITILLSILSSNELRAAPAGLSKIISDDLASRLFSSSSFLKGIITMSLSSKIITAAIVLIIIGVITGLNINTEGEQDNSILARKGINDIKTQKSDITIKRISRINVNKVFEEEIEKNNLKGSALLGYLVECSKKSLNMQEWYAILKDCGINLPSDLFYNHIAVHYPEKIIMLKHLENFLSRVVVAWVKHDSQPFVKWLTDREMSYNSILKPAIEYFGRFDKLNFREFLELLPNSGLKNEYLSQLPVSKEFTYFEAQMNTSLQKNKTKMSFDFKKIILNSIKQHPVQTYQWISQNMVGKDRSRYLRGSLFYVARVNSQFAIQEFEQTERESDKRFMAEMIAAGIFSRGNLKDTEEFINSQSVYKEFAINGVAVEYIEKDPFAALAWFEKMEFKPNQKLIDIMVKSISKSDFYQARSFIESHSKDKDLNQNLKKLLKNTASQFPNKSLDLFQELQEQGVLELKLSSYDNYPLNSNEYYEDAMVAKMVTDISTGLVLKKPKKIIEWLGSLPFKNKAQYTSAMQETLQAWSPNKSSKEDLIKWAYEIELSDQSQEKFVKFLNDQYRPTRYFPGKGR